MDDNCSNDPNREDQSQEITRAGKHGASYWMTLLLNTASFLLPALYVILSKAWIADLEPSFVALTDTFHYLGVISDCLSQGIAKGAWTIIGDKTTKTLSRRYTIAWMVIAIQCAIALAFSIALMAAAPQFADFFVPAAIRDHSVLYVRITTISAACAMIQTALAICARALDKPTVPLAISIAKLCLNILLDLLILSPFRQTYITPTVNTQAWIRTGCDIGSTALGLAYLLWLDPAQLRLVSTGNSEASWSDLTSFIHSGVWTQLQAIPGTVVDSWMTTMVVSLGVDFATAYGIFLTIRCGACFVPLLAIEATCQAFTSHDWNEFRAMSAVDGFPSSVRKPNRTILRPFKAVLLSSLLMLLLELTLFFAFGYWLGRPLAVWLSASEEIADIFVRMWFQIDWGFIMLALYFQSSTILLMTNQKLYCISSVFSTIVFALPMALGFWAQLRYGGNLWLWFTLALASIYAFQLLNNIVWTLGWFLNLRRSALRQIE